MAEDSWWAETGRPRERRSWQAETGDEWREGRRGAGGVTGSGMAGL
jgi:hypothetical protein